MARPFLTARWTNLCLLNYAVDPDLLRPLLPPGIELDTTLDNRAYVSLVAFTFEDTKVCGVRWPGLTNFPEINLRFYVREAPNCPGFADRRGVCFVREFVPSHLIAWAAKLIYNEPYSAARMTSRCVDAPSGTRIEHRLSYQNASLDLSLNVAGPEFVPAPGTPEHWFKEHEWGFGTSRSGSLVRYRVHHPVWHTRRIEQASLQMDWSAIYGPRWADMNSRRPDSVVFATGSAISVYGREA